MCNLPNKAFCEVQFYLHMVTVKMQTIIISKPERQDGNDCKGREGRSMQAPWGITKLLDSRAALGSDLQHKCFEK